MGSHRPVIQAVPFHCVLSVESDFHMQQWLQLSRKRHFTLNHSHVKNKSADYFKRLLLEFQERQSAVFGVKLV